jgi:hypothetical protein
MYILISRYFLVINITVMAALEEALKISFIIFCLLGISLSIENCKLNKLHTYIYIYIYVWKLNQTVLELDLWGVKFLFFPHLFLSCANILTIFWCLVFSPSYGWNLSSYPFSKKVMVLRYRPLPRDFITLSCRKTFYLVD